MKRLISCFLAVCLLCGCSTVNENDVSEPSHPLVETTEKAFEKSNLENEMRAVWISCYELPDATNGESVFKESVSQMFIAIKDFGLNTVFVHVRPFADTIYPSVVKVCLRRTRTGI